MSRIDTVNALLTCLEIFLNIWDNANKLYIMLPCAWIFYIWPAVICFMCNVIVKIAAAHWPHRKQETNYTTVRGCWGRVLGTGVFITNDVLKFRRKIIESSWIVMNCQWIVYLFNHRRKRSSNIYKISKRLRNYTDEFFEKIILL